MTKGQKATLIKRDEYNILHSKTALSNMHDQKYIKINLLTQITVTGVSSINYLNI